MTLVETEFTLRHMLHSTQRQKQVVTAAAAVAEAASRGQPQSRDTTETWAGKTSQWS